MNRWFKRTCIEPWVLARDIEPRVLARDRVSETEIRLRVKLSRDLDLLHSFQIWCFLKRIYDFEKININKKVYSWDLTIWHIWI